MESTYEPTADQGDRATKRLAPLVTRWSSAIAAAKEHRKQEFDGVAEEARKFFDGSSKDFWESMIEQVGSAGGEGFMSGTSLVPKFRISLNRMFDCVALFGPTLYHQNPTIAVTSRPSISVSIDTFYATNPQAMQIIDMIPAIQQGIINDPQIIALAQQLQQQYEMAVTSTERRDAINTDHALILEHLSNYYQQEGHKHTEARLAITEAILTGLGLLEPVLESSPAGGPRVPTSRFVSVRDFLVDPDATYWRDVTWIAIRRVSPRNQVEAKFNLPPGTLKGKGQHASNTALGGTNARQSRKHGNGKVVGKSHEQIEYYDVYSKNGAGQNLVGNEKTKPIRGLEVLGDFIHLAICTSCDYPLNLPDDLPIIEPPPPPQMIIGEDGQPTMAPEEPMEPQATQEALEATAWPAPFWDDVHSDGGWPICRLTFYQNPGKTWPMSMAASCLGEMKFVNWCMSFLADGVAAGSKIYPAMIKSAAASLKEQFANGGGGAFIPLEIEEIAGRSINEIVSFLQAPTFNIDIWNMVAQVNDQIDKRLGLNELLYGNSSRQMRSAAEAQYRQSNISIRPDDMASQVEDWLAVSATREIQLIRWEGSGEDVEPIIGPIGAQVFETQILARDVSDLTREFGYRVAAGTARKPNKDTRIAQMTDMSQYFLPIAQQAMSMGVIGPFNAFIEDLSRAMDLDPSRYVVSADDHATMQQHAMMQQQGVAPPPDMEQAA